MATFGAPSTVTVEAEEDNLQKALENVVVTPTAQPTPTPTPRPLATATPTPVIYTVQAGDVLSAIADRFGVSVEEIVAANELADPDVLAVGQELEIPIADEVTGGDRTTAWFGRGAVRGALFRAAVRAWRLSAP